MNLSRLSFIMLGAGLVQMGQRSLDSIPRAFFIGQARALESKVNIPTVAIPKAKDISQGNIDMLVDNFRVFIDPARCAEVDLMLSLHFSDVENRNLALIVRCGVCEFVSDPSTNLRQPDLSASLTCLAWAKLFTGEATAREFMDSGEIKANENPNAIVEFLEMFDPFDLEDNSAIPVVE